MTSFEFFKLAVHVEEVSRDVYLSMADHPGTPADLREAFLGLAEEEAEHARRVKLFGDSVRGGAWHEGHSQLKGDKLQAAADAHRHLLWEVRTRRRPGDLELLLARLADFELRLGCSHAEELAKSADARMAAFFAGLAKQDRRHAALLDAARRTEAVARAC